MFPSILRRGALSVHKCTANVITNQVMNNGPRHQTIACFSSDMKVAEGAAPEERPFHHFRVSSDAEKKHTKFASPRKRANKIMLQITKNAQDNAHNPNVHDVKFRVGDAIELTMIAQGGVNSNEVEKIRGVVLGIDKRGLGTGFYLRDVVFGEPIDRKIPLYSPLIKDIKVLEENFVFKKKRKVKRAKLYYLRDRLPQETRVTKIK